MYQIDSIALSYTKPSLLSASIAIRDLTDSTEIQEILGILGCPLLIPGFPNLTVCFFFGLFFTHVIIYAFHINLLASLHV